MKPKTVFFCTECGNETPKWLGKCPSCGAWNSLCEHEAVSEKKSSQSRPAGRPRAQALRLRDASFESELRFSTGVGELDRVLGGGAVAGSIVLFGGEPGIGKSTLLLQACGNICAEKRVLYVSGEESVRQTGLRADRLGGISGDLFLLAETALEDILDAVSELSPDVLVVDSIQTMCAGGGRTVPGSVAQIRECTMALMRLAKDSGLTVFIVGHVNKEGAIAGPKALEHIVDCVLYFEGDRHVSHRIVRAAKNRFGSTNEIGVFEMSGRGMLEVKNPSEALLSGMPKDAPGSAVACVLEGSRPILAEIQALICPTSFGNPRRMVSGMDYNRAVLLLAILEKRGGYGIGACDAYINVAGGLRLDEPGAGLPALLSIASSFRGAPVDQRLASFGEVGLAGELRGVSGAEQRLAEIRRLGFERCVMPRQNISGLKLPDGLEIFRAKNILQAADFAIGGAR